MSIKFCLLLFYLEKDLYYTLFFVLFLSLSSSVLRNYISLYFFIFVRQKNGKIKQERRLSETRKYDTQLPKYVISNN